MSYSDRMRIESHIDSVFRDCDSNRFPTVTLGYIAQIITVWASGYLESACREVVLDYTKKRANENIVKYVDHTLNRFSNPKMGKILELLGAVDNEAAEILKEFSDGKIKASVNSIVSNRHLIAHGRSTQITISQVKVYYEDAQVFAKKMRELFA